MQSHPEPHPFFDLRHPCIFLLNRDGCATVRKSLINYMLLVLSVSFIVIPRGTAQATMSGHKIRLLKIHAMLRASASIPKTLAAFTGWVTKRVIAVLHIIGYDIAGQPKAAVHRIEQKHRLNLNVILFKNDSHIDHCGGPAAVPGEKDWSVRRLHCTFDDVAGDVFRQGQRTLSPLSVKDVE